MPMFLIFCAMILASAALYAIHEMSAASNRGPHSWLPKWFFKTNGWIHIDGYHFSGSASRILLFWAGYIFATEGSFSWLHLAVIWFADGNIMSTFMHTIWMRREFREFAPLLWINDFIDGIKNAWDRFEGWF